ncbi:hypothetical protein B0H13DRAFT_2579204, partial [Mycena leptocephala]
LCLYVIISFCHLYLVSFSAPDNCDAILTTFFFFSQTATQRKSSFLPCPVCSFLAFSPFLFSSFSFCLPYWDCLLEAQASASANGPSFYLAPFLLSGSFLGLGLGDAMRTFHLGHVDARGPVSRVVLWCRYGACVSCLAFV